MRHLRKIAVFLVSMSLLGAWLLPDTLVASTPFDLGDAVFVTEGADTSAPTTTDPVVDTTAPTSTTSAANPISEPPAEVPTAPRGAQPSDPYPACAAGIDDEYDEGDDDDDDGFDDDGFDDDDDDDDLAGDDLDDLCDD